MAVVTPDAYVFVVTDAGYAKRTSIDEYRVQGRGGYGIKVFKSSDDRGLLVGGLITGEDDEVLVIMEKGKIVRSSVAEVSATGRNTMGVIFAKPDAKDRIIKIARNVENSDDVNGEAEEATEASDETAETAQAADGES